MTVKLENIKEYHGLLSARKIVLAYGGEIKNGVVPYVMNIIDRQLQNESNVSLKRRVMQVAVECIQNIEKHCLEFETGEKIASILVFKKEDDYMVSFQNRIENEKVDALKEKIEKVNSLDKTALAEYYKKALRENTISEKGGAGLGLIEISRKSGNKINYSFDPVDTNRSNFSLTVMVS